MPKKKICVSCVPVQRTRKALSCAMDATLATTPTAYLLHLVRCNPFLFILSAFCPASFKVTFEIVIWSGLVFIHALTLCCCLCSDGIPEGDWHCPTCEEKTSAAAVDKENVSELVKGEASLDKTNTSSPSGAVIGLHEIDTSNLM